ncbi:hypothetical protein GGI15_001280 [Coemansia interrupta]|uniref:RZ-type domain-containing protein n=1 Tax=Coemansia interrupta TaxID=1126814 RepID=A0A9W8HIS2_9FUNG|nr:hypothetical protein GGI15_001280 [Coemansia interrupta]
MITRSASNKNQLLKGKPAKDIPDPPAKVSKAKPVQKSKAKPVKRGNGRQSAVPPHKDIATDDCSLDDMVHKAIQKSIDELVIHAINNSVKTAVNEAVSKSVDIAVKEAVSAATRELNLVSSLSASSASSTSKTETKLSVTNKEIISVKKAIPNVSWHQCPNSHWYAVGECRTPAVNAKCIDCNAHIGANYYNHQAPHMKGRLNFK